MGTGPEMVASVGNAPTFHALQACAHLSKPRSHLKFMVFRGIPRGNLARFSCVKPIFQFTTLSVLTARRVLRTLGLLWSSLVMNHFVIVLYFNLKSAFVNLFFQLSLIGISLQTAVFRP